MQIKHNFTANFSHFSGKALIPSRSIPSRSPPDIGKFVSLSWIKIWYGSAFVAGLVPVSVCIPGSHELFIQLIIFMIWFVVLSWLRKSGWWGGPLVFPCWMRSGRRCQNDFPKSEINQVGQERNDLKKWHESECVCDHDHDEEEHDPWLFFQRFSDGDNGSRMQTTFYHWKLGNKMK